MLLTARQKKSIGGWWIPLPYLFVVPVQIREISGAEVLGEWNLTACHQWDASYFTHRSIIPISIYSIITLAATFLISLMFISGRSLASERMSLEGLGTESSKWHVQIPGNAQRELEISEPAKANWTKYGVLSLSARLSRPIVTIPRMDNAGQYPAPSLQTVHLLIYLQNKDSWWYQSASTFSITDRRWTTIELDISSESADWVPSGHFRPWDGYVTSYITKVGVKAFSHVPYVGEIELKDIELRKAYGASQRAKQELALLDFATNRDKVNVGELFEIRFRLSKTYNNPFDEDEIDVSAVFESPTGQVATVSGFFDQEYIEKIEMNRFSKPDQLGFTNRRLVPIGASLWKIRYVPEEIGLYKYGIIIRDSSATNRSIFKKSQPEIVRLGPLSFRAISKSQIDSGSTAPQTKNLMTPSEPPTPVYTPAPSDRKTGDISILFLDSTYPHKKGALPPFVKEEDSEGAAVYSYTPTGWKRAEIPKALLRGEGRKILLWRVPLQWTPKWGKYRGLGQFNLEVAWQFEKMLERAEASGISLPIRLNGDEEYLNREIYRWPDNPLNIQNGGPLKTPSQYFTNPVAAKWFKNEVRYIIARWGYSRALGDLWLCKHFLADNADVWHEQMGKYLSQIYGVHWNDDRVDANHIRRQIFSMHPQADGIYAKRLISGVERGYTNWSVERRISPRVESRIAKNWSSEGRRSLKLNVSFPGEAAIYKPLDSSNDNWSDYDKLAFDVYIPPHAPGDMRVMVYLRDGDLWWYEQLLKPYLRPGDWTKLWVDLRGRKKRQKGRNRSDLLSNSQSLPPKVAYKRSRWVAQGHSKPWNNYTRQRIQEVGLRFFGHEEYRGPLYVDNVELWSKKKHKAQELAPTVMYDFSINNDKIERYKKFEVTFRLSRTYSNPYDPEIVDIMGEFTSPSGKVFKIPAFFYQSYRRKLEDALSGEDNKIERLIPDGEPCWKIRFAPTEVGRYSYTITIKDNRRSRTEPMSFECLPSDDPGFVRISKSDRRYFERDNGDFFYPIGHNLRSPVDVRPQAYRDLLISDASERTNWGGRIRRFQIFTRNRRYLESIKEEGTYLFDRFFERMANNGENWTRIWMCPWWCGIEWKRERYGYHGIGRYNQQNAWRLDYLIEQAEKKNIFVQLITTNHGQYTSNPQLDAEWPNNPYNTRNGGFLRWAGDFYRSTKAKKMYRNRMRYTVARWGYSTKIMAWILMGEVEWTDGYTWSRRDVHTWLKEMARYMKDIDPWQHIVSTHFSNVHHGLEVWSFPEMEACFNNAYTPLNELHSRNVVQAVNNFYYMWMGRYGKPTLISEWGGYWMSNSNKTLLTELHSGIWASFMTPLAGSTGFWWWNFIDAKDLYHHYKGIANFAKGEDLRGGRYVKIRSGRSRISRYRLGIFGRGTSGEALACEGMVNGKSGYLWVYDPAILERVPDWSDDDYDFERMRSSLTISSWQDGMYRIEYWHTYKGEKVYEIIVEAYRSKLRIRLPRIKTDIAIKIKPE